MSNNTQYPTLSSPASIGSLTLKNRIMLAAMGSNFAELNGQCGERLQAYYEERAKGGAGMLILETTSIAWPAGCSMPNMVGFSSDEFLPGLSRVAERVHKHGCKIAAQLNHSGKVSQEDIIAGRPVLVPTIPHKGASDMMPLLTPAELGNFIKAGGPDGKGPRYHEMTEADIQTLIKQFADAATRAKQAGFDAIEVHGGHGYVISSFLSPAVNKREDQYGGSTENRARLMGEIITEIRAAVGADFPILIRMDANEYRVEGGITPALFLEYAKLAEQAGADAIDVSAYGNTAKGIAFTEAPLVHEPGGFLPFVKQVKRVVTIPIIAVGRIEIDVAEQGLNSGDFDFVAMGRKLIADPDLPNKVMTGNSDAIRPCIYCYICVSQIFINQPLCCAVNSDVGREDQPSLIQTDRPAKKVLVVGSGPGGMEAARLLASQGHQVSLWEKDRDLGGTARIAALAYEPNGRLIRYLSEQMVKLGVDVQRNKVATIDNIRAYQPDHVFVATGAARKAPDFIGKDLSNVFDGEQMRGLLFGTDASALKKLPLYQQVMLTLSRTFHLLRNIAMMRKLSKIWMPIKKRVVVIGGGLVGLEMAEFLQERGREIIVLEPSANLAPELSIVRRSRVIHLLKEHGAKLITNAEIKEITATHVEYEHEGKVQQAAGQQVIIAMGAQPETGLADQLKSTGLPVTAIGDCQKIGYIDGAILDARNAVAAFQ